MKTIGNLQFKKTITKEEVASRYREFYGKEPLIKIVDDIPEVRDAAKKHFVTIGGLEVITTPIIIICLFFIFVCFINGMM